MGTIKSLSGLRNAVFVCILTLAAVAAIACGSDPMPTPVPTSTTPPQPTPTTALAPTAAPTPAPTNTPVPPAATSTPRPTSAPQPTATPTPAPTFTPTPAPTPTPSLFPLTITDSNGKDFVFDAPPERIIVYDGAAVDILFAIGQGHRVAGTHDFVTYPPETADVPRVGSAFTINTEAIIDLEPDLIYTFFASSVEALEATGVPVLLIDSLGNNLEDFIEHFRLWGRLTDSVEEAEVLAADIEARLEALSETLKAVETPPRLYSHGFDFWTPGGDTLFGDIFELLRVDLITNDQSGWAQLSPEQILEKDPEIIVTDESGAQQLAENSAFDDVSAVKNGRIIFPEMSFSIAGTTLVPAIEEMAALLHPHLFP